MNQAINKKNPPSFSAWVGVSALIHKELVRVFRIAWQTLFPSVITSILYFMIFGRIIGSRIGLIDGISYVQFIVPGLVMLAVINNSYSNLSNSIYGAKLVGAIQEILISPLSSGCVLFGYLVGGVVRGMIVGFLVILVSLFFTHLHIQHIFATFCVMLVTAFIFSAVGFINGLLANSFDAVSFVPMFVLTPLIYLGGVFYQVSSLPPVWRSLSRFNPIYYVIDSFRQAMLMPKINLMQDTMLFAIVFFAVIFASLWVYTHSQKLRS